MNFTKAECIITNKNGEVTMKGIRNKDNYCLWVTLETNLKDKQSVDKNSLKGNTCLNSPNHNVPMNVLTSVKSAKVNDQSTEKRTMNLVQKFTELKLVNGYSRGWNVYECSRREQGVCLLKKL